MDKIKITEPNAGKYITIAGDINSILASKDDTIGTDSIVEIKVFPNGGPIPPFKLVNMKDSMFWKVRYHLLWKEKK